MNAKEVLLRELASADLLVKVKALSRVGAQWPDAETLLPTLREFVSKADNREAEDVCAAVLSIGALLRNCGQAGGRGFDGEYLEFLINELDESKGVYSSSLIFALALLGTRGASQRARKSVLAVACSQDAPDLLKYRAYQYATAVDRLLLDTKPWKDLVPPTAELRANWDFTQISGFGR
jgi:hypothetical protein